MANNSGRWEKGQSGNPNGRPPKVKCLTDLLRSGLAEKGRDGKPKMQLVVDRVIRLALQGERWAVELIYERLEGKPAQALTLTGDEKRPVTFRYIDGNKGE